MGALKDADTIKELERESGPPSSRSRPVQGSGLATDPSLPPPDPNRTQPSGPPDVDCTDPSMPPPDPNRPPPGLVDATNPGMPTPPQPKRRRRKGPRPPEAAPDALDTPEYVAPQAPPDETEHKTFEVQTVKVMEEQRLHDTEKMQPPPPPPESPEPPPPRDPGLREADLPTQPSTRVHRQRSWTVGIVLVALGVVAGLGLLALAWLTRVEPLEPGTPAASQPLVTPPDRESPNEAASAKGAAVTTSTLPAASASPKPASDEAEPAVKTTAPLEGARDAPKAETPPAPGATSAPKDTTSTVPLGPPEF